MTINRLARARCIPGGNQEKLTTRNRRGIRAKSSISTLKKRMTRRHAARAFDWFHITRLCESGGEGRVLAQSPQGKVGSAPEA